MIATRTALFRYQGKPNADYEPSMYVVGVHAFAHLISRFCAYRGAWLGELVALLSGLTSPSG